MSDSPVKNQVRMRCAAYRSCLLSATLPNVNLRRVSKIGVADDDDVGRTDQASGFRS